MTQIRITGKTAVTALIGALVLVPAAASACKAAETPAEASDSGNEAAVNVLNDMSQVMQHWMTEMSDPSGLSSEEQQRMARAMRKMSVMMENMSSMMQTASQSGSQSPNQMMGGGHGMMSGNRQGMMMDSPMMRRMHEQMQAMLASEEKS